MDYRQVPGDEIVHELLQGHSVAMLENANVWHKLIDGSPYLIDKNGVAQPLFGNSSAYERFLKNLCQIKILLNCYLRNSRLNVDILLLSYQKNSYMGKLCLVLATTPI